MTSPNASGHSSAPHVAIHLLDPAKGRPLQSWTFDGLDRLQIGRLEENDVVLPDPAVSRLHAIFQFQDGYWRLDSFGKHGVLINDRRVESCILDLRQTVFRLGANGPTLMFDRQDAAPEESQKSQMTVEFDSFVVGELGFDRNLAADQVRQITDDQSFQKLLQQAAELKKKRAASSD